MLLFVILLLFSLFLCHFYSAQPQRENRRRVQNNKENIEDQNKNKDSSSSVPNGRNDRRYQKKQWNK